MRVPVLLLLCALFVSSTTFAGDLTPPGAPAGTMKTLNEVEARIPIHNSDLPLTITSNRSYYFAENLRYNVQNSDAITISAVHVSIDMNGFTLSGPGKATGTSGYGIYRSNANFGYSDIRNGHITDFRAGGMYIGKYSSVSNVNSSYNGEYGIRMEDHAVVTDCICTRNGGGSSLAGAWGIKCMSYCRLSGNLCNDNDSGTSGDAYGIQAADGCDIRDNVCSAQTAGGSGVGINCGDRSTVTGNTCSENTGPFARGIKAGSNSIIKENTCSKNVGTDEGIGIHAMYSCLISDNVCQGNIGTGTNASGYGIWVQSGRLTGNECIDSDGKGTGQSAGIRAGHYSRIESNHVTHSSGTNASSYGIMVEGDRTSVISNTVTYNVHDDIIFMAATSHGYAGGNISDDAITDNGTNNESGTTPAPNVRF